MPKLPALPHGPAPLSAGAAALLGGLAAKLGQPATPTIDPALVEATEAELQAVIPYEVLALLAVERRMPAALVDWTEGIEAYYAACEAPVRFRHVAFAQLVGTPEEWTEEPCFAVFARTTNREVAPRIMRWDVRKPGPDGRPFSIAEYLVEVHELNEPGSAPPLALRIEPPPPPATRYARHAKFGRGRVLERAEGKVKVEFADGVRVLGEQFLIFE